MNATAENAVTTEPLEVSPAKFCSEIEAHLDVLRVLRGDDLENFLRSSEIIATLDQYPEMWEQGGAKVVLVRDLNYSESDVSKRRLVGINLVIPLGLEIVQDAGFTATETLYLAARAVKGGMSPDDALETFAKLTRDQAREHGKNVADNEFRQIKGRFPTEVCASFERGLTAAGMKGFTTTQLLERLGAFLLEADRETLQRFAEMVES